MAGFFVPDVSVGKESGGRVRWLARPGNSLRCRNSGQIKKPKHAEADGRNAVFYGDKGIDRSPCGTGTSSRMAHLAALGKLKVGDDFVHESIIGSLFKGRVEAAVKVGERDAIIPSVGGWARMTGYNTIFIDDRDPFAHGFVVV